ncbi:hypothetical protein Tco_1180470, partial [Tanacetum coccineum]
MPSFLLKEVVYETWDNEDGVLGIDELMIHNLVEPLSLNGNRQGKKGQEEYPKGNIMISSHLFLFEEQIVAITLKTKGGLDYLSFDDLYNKLRTLEIDVKGGSSYDSRGTSAPTHSAFISVASTNSKMSYPDCWKHEKCRSLPSCN